MITVAILINNTPIIVKSAVNQKEMNDKGETKYKMKSGEIIWHKREKGAEVLAKKMLEIKERGE